MGVNPTKGYAHYGTAATAPSAPAMSGDVLTIINQQLGYDLMLAAGAQQHALENFQIAEAHLGVGLETWPEE